MTPFRCPDSAHLKPPEHGPLYVVGCGHVFSAEPDFEGLIDCPSCGMWFRAVDPEANLTRRIPATTGA